MPNTHSTLPSLFFDIADAIRAKKGTSTPIVADNFPTEILGIISGSISDTTATASDVAASKVFYLADGTAAVGSIIDANLISY